MDEAHDDAYLRYVVARLAAFHNVWWTMANEYNFWDDNLPGFGGRKLNPKNWDHLFETLSSADPYAHIRGIHNIGAWYDHRKSWITHVIAQQPQNLSRATRDGRNEYRKPVVMDEVGYEGNNGQDWGDFSAVEYVSRHWDVTMAGGYASHGETYVHPRGIVWWSVGGELIGDAPARLSFLKAIMTAAEFQTLEPAAGSERAFSCSSRISLLAAMLRAIFESSAVSLLYRPSAVR